MGRRFYHTGQFARKVSVSIKALEVHEEKEAIAQFGSTDSGASLGDILGAGGKEAGQAGRYRDALHRRTAVALPIAERESHPVSMWYATEGFTDDERAILSAHFSSLESPVWVA